MKIDRLVSIILMLLEKKRISAQALAEIFEVSPRTIYRDMDAISRAGIPIRATSGAGGGFEIMPAYKIDKTVFSTADLSALLMGLSGISAVVRGDELANALAKVRRFIPAEQAKDIELKANQIHIDLRPWVGNSTVQPNLETIEAALQESKLLSFFYIDRFGNQTARTVEPYQLVSKSSHWYLQAYCRTRNDFRLFRLSRILNLQMEEEVFVPRAYQKPQLDIDDMVSAMQKTITLRIHYSIMDRVLDDCAYDRFSPDGDSHFIVRFPFIETDYYYDMLLRFGDKCECLAPPSVREKLRQKIQKLAALYEA